MHGRCFLVAAALLVAAPASTHAASRSGDTEFTITPEKLSKTTRLVGSVRFRTPVGWRRFGRSEGNQPMFVKAGADGCRLRLAVSVDGVATGRTPAEQVARAVGDAPLGQGTRRGGYWGTTTPLSAGTRPSQAGLRGVASVHLGAKNRFGQLEVTGELRDCAATSPGAQALLAAGGPTVHQVNHLLARADTRLHVAPLLGDYPRLLHTPEARYSIEHGSMGRYVSLAVVLRTDRALDRSRFGVLAAPSLRHGTAVPDELFGGTTPGSIGAKDKHCYVAEPSQLKRRTTIGSHRWQLAVNTGYALAPTPFKHVRLERFQGDRWELEAAHRLGC